MSAATSPRAPLLWEALAPLLFLVALLAGSVALFGDSSSGGPNQIALVLAMAFAALIGRRLGHRWTTVQEAIARGLALGANAIFILLAVGALIGAWILSGTVPTIIYYGIAIIDPAIFYLACCLVCALVSLSIGSSWTTAGTVGVALMGIAQGLGLSPAITAGAVVSGAYFGDKMSPLSDTTNLAPAAAGSELFAHIRHMAWTTGPSFLITLALFALLGWGHQGATDGAAIQTLREALRAQFDLGLHLMLPLVLLLAMAWRKMPAFPTILVGALCGVLFALVFQPDLVARLGGSEGIAGTIAGAWKVLFAGYQLESSMPALDDLLRRGGMASMLDTVWLIACALAFGSVMESLGMLARLVAVVLAAARTTASLILAVLATAFGVNLIAADQYLAIVLPGRIYRHEFERRGLAPENLSRALEDAGTLTSPLVPWNTCGAYMAATLGVSTLAYLPFAFFNLLNPLIAALMAIAGWKIARSPAAHETGGAR
ncbi:MAG: Na+/H+ antiporter NhaC [Lysobacterales bacterium]|jgi:NhaC family Na+:H+ antiporter|nr:MAG: Na+/H+ antiporter NhaC [Xanthomonadales bacterium]